MLFERKDPLEKAIWLDGFLQAFAQIALQDDVMPYATIQRIQGKIDPKIELAKSFAVHHPFERRKVVVVNDSIRIVEGNRFLSNIEEIRDLEKSLHDALYGWLFIFLGFWNKQTIDTRFVDQKTSFNISEEACRQKLVKELTGEICQIFDHTQTSKIYSASYATGIRFIAVGKLDSWLLVFS